MKDWLMMPKNDRLSITEAFGAFDHEGYGELSLANFEAALGRLGIALSTGEL
jgi:Ca2+-binding EF-hand superfamily protein